MKQTSVRFAISGGAGAAEEIPTPVGGGELELIEYGHLLLQKWTPGMDVRRRNAVVNCPTGTTMLNIVENGIRVLNKSCAPKSRKCAEMKTDRFGPGEGDEEKTTGYSLGGHFPN
ncbi:hypothetical protein QTP88_024923 [Uroleucon formosanum]